VVPVTYRQQRPGPRAGITDGACLTLLLLAALGAPGAGAPPAAQVWAPAVRPAPPLEYPTPRDSNSPLYWDGGTLYLLTNGAGPGDTPFSTWRSAGPAFGSWAEVGLPVAISPPDPRGQKWIESVYRDPAGGPLFGFYHLEPFGAGGTCEGWPPPQNELRSPEIGVARSTDGGMTWQDEGILLRAPPGSDRCDSEVISGGRGDFAAVDGRDGYLYLFFTNYQMDVVDPSDRTATGRQGVAVARLPVAGLRDGGAIGKVELWDGRWAPAGPRGDGPVTPLFPARRNWFFRETEGLWGPQPFYSARLGGFVLVLNLARGGRGTPMLHPAYSQEGVYVSFNRRPADPRGWSAPTRLELPEGDDPRWYAQVLGTGPGESDTFVAGCAARLFMDGRSEHRVDLCAGPGRP
jgi:hypothetical protein